MLLPLKTDRPLHRPTLTNYILVGANIAIFVILSLVERFAPNSYQDIIEPFVLGRGGSASAGYGSLAPWTFLTYAFLHADIWHLLGNMLFLWVFGANIEDRLGRIGYLAYYLIGAAASGGVHVLFSHHPVIGASGAVSAVTGGFLVLFPRTHIQVLLFFFIIGMFSIPSWWFIGFAILRDFIPFFGRIQDGVSHEAHIGGYVYGFSVCMTLLLTGILKREVYDLTTIMRQAQRRRGLREATRTPTVTPTRPRTDAVADQVSDELAEARARVSAAISEGNLDKAADRYEGMIETFGRTRGAAVLSRQNQLAVANHLFQLSRYQSAHIAYSQFRETYASDSEVPTVLVLLGLLNARYLNDPVAARTDLREALDKLPSDDDHAQLARDLLEELA